MDALTDTQLRQIEQHRIRQIEMRDTKIARQRRKLLPAVLLWAVQRKSLLADLAYVRGRLAPKGGMSE